MTTTLQKWGNSQGIRLPKSVLTQMHIRTGAELEIVFSPDQAAIIVSLAKPSRKVRGRHRIQDLVAGIPKSQRASEFSWGQSGKEVW